MSITNNTAFNIVGSTLPLLVSLATIPIYLSLIGEARYGVLAVAWLLLGYFGLFDLGLSRATAQRIGYLRTGSDIERATVFWTGVLVNIFVGFLGILIIWPTSYYLFKSAVNIDENLRIEIINALPWLVASIPLITLSGVLSGALIGREKFLELNIVSVVGSSFLQLLPLASVITWGPELTIIMPTVLLSRVLTLVAMFYLCNIHVFSNHRVTFKSNEAKRLIKFGGWVTATSIVGPIMVITDRIIIGVTSGAVAVTFYTVPFQLGKHTTVLARSVANALFPRLSGLKKIEQEAIADKAQCALISIITPFYVLGLVLIESFLSIWISQEFSDKTFIVGIIIILGFWINSFALIPQALLQARERPDIPAKFLFYQIVPYLILLYFGLKSFGLPGAAFAFSIRAAIDTILLCWAAGQLRISLIKIFVPTLTVSVAIFIAIKSDYSTNFWILSLVIITSFSFFYSWQTIPKSIKNKISGIKY